MKLRFLKLSVETTVKFNAGSRRQPRIEECFEQTEELSLQFFDEKLKAWVDVPTEHEYTDRFQDRT